MTGMEIGPTLKWRQIRANINGSSKWVTTDDEWSAVNPDTSACPALWDLYRDNDPWATCRTLRECKVVAQRDIDRETRDKARVATLEKEGSE